MNEEDILIELVRNAYQFQTTQPIQIRDWQAFQSLSDRHRVTPAIATVDLGPVSPSVREWAMTALIRSSQAIIAARRALDQIAFEFNSRGIRALVLKGLALQGWVYGRICRVIGDIDLFVMETDHSKVEEALQELGFLQFPQPGATTWKNKDHVELDVHTCMLEPYIGRSLAFADAWERRIEVEHVALPTLCPADHLVFVLVHAFKHQWSRLSWLVDTALIAQRLSSAEWQMAIEQAKKQGAHRIALVGLELCRQVLSPPGVPWDCILESGDRVAQSLALEYRARLFVPIRSSLRVKIVNSVRHLRALEGLRARGRYIYGRCANAIRRALIT